MMAAYLLFKADAQPDGGGDGVILAEVWVAGSDASVG